MLGIDWRDDLKLGFTEIDEQHKKLIQTMSDLNQAIINKEADKVITSTFVNLFEYTNKHFALEEKYFDQFGYEDADAHKAAHAYFANMINEKFKKIYGDPHELSVELIGFLDLWLVGHIMVMDKKYEQCFKEHGIK
jgi:hemerythrin-like metal-binding protein